MGVWKCSTWFCMRYCTMLFFKPWTLLVFLDDSFLQLFYNLLSCVKTSCSSYQLHHVTSNIQPTLCTVNTIVVMRCQMLLWLCCFTIFWAILFIIYWISFYIRIIDGALFISVESSMLETFLICEYWGSKGFPAWVVKGWTVVYQIWSLECIPMFLYDFHY